MNLRLEYKRYVILGLKLPSLGEFYFIGDTDDLAEALALADRNKGHLVFAVPEEARLGDGGNYVVETGRAKIVKLEN